MSVKITVLAASNHKDELMRYGRMEGVRVGRGGG